MLTSTYTRSAHAQAGYGVRRVPPPDITYEVSGTYAVTIHITEKFKFCHRNKRLRTPNFKPLDPRGVILKM